METFLAIWFGLFTVVAGAHIFEYYRLKKKFKALEAEVEKIKTSIPTNTTVTPKP